MFESQDTLKIRVDDIKEARSEIMVYFEVKTKTAKKIFVGFVKFSSLLAQSTIETLDAAWANVEEDVNNWLNSLDKSKALSKMIGTTYVRKQDR